MDRAGSTLGRARTSLMSIPQYLSASVHAASCSESNAASDTDLPRSSIAHTSRHTEEAGARQALETS